MRNKRKTEMSSKKGISTILAVGIIVVIIAAVVGGVSYYYLSMPSSEDALTDTVSSLQFKTEQMPDVSGTITGTMTGYLKDIGTDNLKMRMEVAIEGETFMMLIANGEQKKAWIWTTFSNTWMDISGEFQKQWSNAEKLVDEILLGLSKGELKEFNYTDPTTNESQNFKVAEYQVNPNLADSLFARALNDSD